MAIITLDTIVGYWKDVSDFVRGLYKPLFQKFGRQQLILSTTALGISGVYTSQTFDTLAMPQINYVSAHCYADQSGTLILQVSSDNVNWNFTQLSEPVSVNTSTTTGWQQPYDRFFRIVFQNGATAQTVLRLSCTMHD